MYGAIVSTKVEGPVAAIKARSHKMTAEHAIRPLNKLQP